MNFMALPAQNTKFFQGCVMREGKKSKIKVLLDYTIIMEKSTKYCPEEVNPLPVNSTEFVGTIGKSAFGDRAWSRMASCGMFSFYNY